MYRTQAGLVCHRNPDETVRSVDRSTALRLNTGVHAKHPGQLQYLYKTVTRVSVDLLERGSQIKEVVTARAAGKVA
jgi:hypothetical protein